MKCPKPTQDVALNLKNRQKAIDDIGYGPLNPSEENDKFWQKKADSWDVSIADAKKQLCGNCAGFNRSKEMLDCIDKGMGEKDDSWDVIDAGQLGYCEPLDFKCAASRTCDAWIDGNAKKNDKKVALVEAYFRKVDEFLAVVDVKEDKPTGEVMFGSELREGMTIMLDGKRTTLLRFGYTQFAAGGGEMWTVDAHVGDNEKDTEVEIHSERTYEVVKGSGAEHVHAKTWYYDPETKVRRVRDAAFWGVPVNTPITPGMKPIKPKAPSIRKPSVRVSKPRSAKPTSKPSSSSASPSMAEMRRGGWSVDKLSDTDVEMFKRSQRNYNGWLKVSYSTDPDNYTWYAEVSNGTDKFDARPFDNMDDAKSWAEKLDSDWGDEFDASVELIRQRRGPLPTARRAKKSDIEYSGTFYIDPETKVRKVRDAGFWGLPVGTPIKPGMKPVKPSGKTPGSGKVRVNVRLGEPKRPSKPGNGDSGSKKPKATSGDGIGKATSGDGIGKAGSGDGIGVSKARDTFESDADKDYVAAARQLEKDGWKWTEDSNSPGTYGLKKPGSDKDAAVVVYKDGEWEADEELLESTIEKMNADKGKSDKGNGPDTSVRDAKDFSVKSAAEELGKIKVDGSKDGSGALDDPIDCGSDIEMAHKLLAEGKHVRLDSPMEVSVLMDRIADEAAFAKQSGGDVPDYDLCKISVPKTNLFCLESKGIPRVNMPQFSGAPVEGSYAATKYDEEKGESNIVDDFAALLEEMGISVEEKDVKVTELKASQNQLVGTKVAGMRKAMREGKIKDAPIYVTRDGYIVDGHHRWAAKMGLDLEDGKLGDVDMPVLMIDAEIGYILDLSNGFTEMAGIKPKATGKAADGVKSLAGDWAPCIGCEGHVYDSAVVEEKIRRVRDSGFWGLPVGTPIKPGMKPRVRLPKAGSRDEMLPPGAGASRALKPSQRVIDTNRAGTEVYRATDSRGGEASVEKLVAKDKKPIYRVTYQNERGRTAYEVFDDENSARMWLNGRMFGSRQEEVGGAKPRTPAVKTPTPDYKLKKSDYEGWDLVSFDVGKGTDYYVGQDDDGTWMATEGDSWSKVRVSGKKSKKEAIAALQSIEGLKQHRLNIAKEGKGRPGARIMVRRGAKGPGKAFEGNEESKPRLYKLPPSVVRELGYRWEETDDPTKRKWRVSGDSVEVYGEDGRKEILNDVDYYIDVFDTNAEDASGPERAKLKRMADSLRKFKANLEADAPEKPKKAEGEKPMVGPGSDGKPKPSESENDVNAKIKELSDELRVQKSIADSGRENPATRSAARKRVAELQREIDSLRASTEPVEEKKPTWRYTIPALFWEDHKRRNDQIELPDPVKTSGGKVTVDLNKEQYNNLLSDVLYYLEVSDELDPDTRKRIIPSARAVLGTLNRQGSPK